jgi:hypothetical protein
VITHHPDGTATEGKITAKGIFINGFAYFFYEIIDVNGFLWKNGVSVVRISKIGEIFGYWLAEDIYQQEMGKFIMGEVELSRSL